ncbi:hypothetical protein HPB50_002510 [Hyalomma asiaticum]|uniref:Uncharacterized protein n=1 Tax=Hyalomma asiaticum TaxID=266040 RepID=A0ACB7SDL2_HYAAI|nr:hypothetical protein HPB50_002510 [Hyalomma asiaticum]
MARNGVDSRQSWLVAAFSSWFLFMACAGQRVFGIIYIGILQTFQVTRQEASWPMSVIDLLASLSRVMDVDAKATGLRSAEVCSSTAPRSKELASVDMAVEIAGWYFAIHWSDAEVVLFLVPSKNQDVVNHARHHFLPI